MKNVKVGLIGPGRNPNGYGIGHFIAREVLNYRFSELIAIMGTKPQSVRKEILDLNARDDVIKKFEGSIYTADEKDEFFCNKEIDLIIICSPANTHLGYIKQAVVSGKHVLVDKPLLIEPMLSAYQRIETARKLADMAVKAGLLLSTNCQRVAVIPVITQEFSYPRYPSHAEIILKIGARNGQVLDPAGLFELLIAHPLSLLVKYGITNLESVQIREYCSNIDADSCLLCITGEAPSKDKKLNFRIELRQSKRYAFTSMGIDLDHKGVIEASNELFQNGDIKTRYMESGPSGRIKYSEDNLKESVVRMIDAVYYKDKKRKPLISCLETYLIYGLEETIKNSILLKYGSI